MNRGNYDPQIADGKNNLKVAIGKFQEKSNIETTGEATEGLLDWLQ